MDKAQIAGVLEQIATLLELKDENPFKIRAYVNAARSIEQFGGSFSDLTDEAALAKIPGVGKAIAAKIKELAETGTSKFHQELRTEFPAGILDLFSIPGLGAKKIKALYEQLNISSIEQLQHACENGTVATLPGFGATTQEKLCKAIGERTKHAGSFQLGAIANEAETLLRDLQSLPDALQVAVAGSYRRRKEIVRDLDFIVATSQPQAVTNAFVQHPLVTSVMAQGATKTSVRLASGIQSDLRVVSAGEYPFALNYFTGSKEHNIVMRNRALQRGWTLNEYRLGALPMAEGKKKPLNIPRVDEERDLYRALGLDYIAPELRENCGEFEAAEQHNLPRLIEWENLRGTFHCHTSASDGHNTLEEMVEAARDLGLQYLGIADHSRSSIQAHGIDAAKLRAQTAAIRSLNEQLATEVLPSPQSSPSRRGGRHAGATEPGEGETRTAAFRVFSGVECDILRDGSLDFDDDVLAELDFVVASVHSAFHLPEAEMTKRVIRAISNPHVTMLAHPTGRLLLRREGYAIDIPAVLDAAAQTGTWVELNSAPKRLDLDWRWWPTAKAKGVKCVINPDAHRVERLHDLWFGIGAARKGWLTRNDVMNCLPLEKIEPELRKKRKSRERK